MLKLFNRSKLKFNEVGDRIIYPHGDESKSCSYAEFLCGCVRPFGHPGKCSYKSKYRDKPCNHCGFYNLLCLHGKEGE